MTPLEPGKYYHIFNRSNGKERIFLNSGNYIYFLNKYKEHLTPVIETYCYCLMPTHFHFLIKVKEEKEIESYINIQGKDQSVSQYISKRFSNFFSSYTQAFNKQQHRNGSLFQKNFKRKEIGSEKYLYQLIHYIHYNPVLANLVPKPEDWEFSSYIKLISSQPTFLRRNEVLDLYDGLENFIAVHSQPINFEDPF